MKKKKQSQLIIRSKIRILWRYGVCTFDDIVKYDETTKCTSLKTNSSLFIQLRGSQKIFSTTV